MRRSNHPRGRYALLLGLLPCAPAAPTSWPNELGQLPPNILLVNLDDAGFGDLAANEGSRLGNNTPNFDRLANESLRLTDFHAAASVCSPSRASPMARGPWAVETARAPVPGGGARCGCAVRGCACARVRRGVSGVYALCARAAGGGWSLDTRIFRFFFLTQVSRVLGVGLSSPPGVLQGSVGGPRARRESLRRRYFWGVPAC